MLWPKHLDTSGPDEHEQLQFLSSHHLLASWAPPPNASPTTPPVAFSNCASCRKPHARSGRAHWPAWAKTRPSCCGVNQRLGWTQVRQILHALRQRGNEAAHQVNHRIGYREGLIHQSWPASWPVVSPHLWQRPQFKPGPFVLPDDPSQKLVTLQQQIAALQGQLSKPKPPRPRRQKSPTASKPGRARARHGPTRP